LTHIEYLPDAALQQDIKRISLVEKPSTFYDWDDIMPDAYTELVVNCGAPVMLVRDDGSEVELPDVFLNRIQSQPMRFRANGTYQVIAVCLYPWAQPKHVALLAGTSITMLNDQWTCFAQSLRHTFHTSGYAVALDNFQQFFTAHTGTLTSPTLLREVGQLVFDANGHLRIADLAAQHFFSISQVERVFKQHLGVTPKQFSRLVRFRAVCSSLMADPTQSAIALAQQFGYTDQAHFIHDFKSIARRTPGEFAAQMKVAGSYGNAENLQYV